MSNTSIGDVELSERTYPFIIRQYSLREGSGGNGRHKGGEGCVRAVEFTRDVDCAILSDRRTNAPYGMNGGEPGARGKNVWVKNRNGVKSTINLGGRNQMRCLAGDMVVISEWTRQTFADCQTLRVAVDTVSPAARMMGPECNTSRTSPTSRICVPPAQSLNTARRSSLNNSRMHVCCDYASMPGNVFLGYGAPRRPCPNV